MPGKNRERKMIGRTLSHCKITEQLGKGGIGEAYQAKDREIKLGMAIKVLPEKPAGDAERVAPCERGTSYLLAVHARAF